MQTTGSDCMLSISTAIELDGLQVGAQWGTQHEEIQIGRVLAHMGPLTSEQQVVVQGIRSARLTHRNQD